MPISAVDQANLASDFAPWVVESQSLKAIMLPVGVAGEAAKRAEVVVVLAAIIDVLYGTAAPTIGP